jgi:sorbitol-specific phosphotransferase system component IIC
MMKRSGIIILAIGLLIAVFTGFKFITKEKVVDVGELQISRNKKHSYAWSPLIGVAVMVIGGGVILIGAKK